MRFFYDDDDDDSSYTLCPSERLLATVSDSISFSFSLSEACRNSSSVYLPNSNSDPHCMDLRSAYLLVCKHRQKVSAFRQSVMVTSQTKSKW